MLKDRSILLLAIGETLVWAGLFYSFPALLLRWETDLGWSKALITGAVTLAIALAALASPFTGRIIDAGRGPVLMAGSAITGGLAMVALSMVATPWLFYVIWAVIGMTTAGCLYEPCFSLLTRARGANAKRGIIHITLLAGFAGTISFPSMHALSEAFGWRFATVAAGVVVVTVAAPLLWLGASRVEREGRAFPVEPVQQHPPRRDFLKRNEFWALALGLSFLAVVHSATLQHLLPILASHGVSAETAVVAASFIGPMQVAGRVVMMATERYTSHHGVAIAAYAMMGTAVLLLRASGSSISVIIAFVILFGGAVGTLSILRPLLVRDVLGQSNFGAKSGALALPYLIGSASAPYAGSLIWLAGGYDALLISLAITVLAGFLLYLHAHRLAFRRVR